MNLKNRGKKIIIIVGTILVIVVLLASLIPKILFPDVEEPVVTGEYGVQISTYTWVDESRIETFSDTGENRALTVKFWYPEKEGNYPLVVFSHGAFGVIDSNYSTCMELASNGYVVASIAHPYHAIFVEDVNGNKTFVDMDFMKQVYADNGADDAEAEKAAKESEAPFSRIDSERIGLFGHSMGGATSVQIGRERDDIDAVINLEGTMAGEYVNDFVGRNAVNYREVIFDDAGHLNFTDLPLYSPILAGLLGVGEVDAKECIENVNEVVLTFFDYYLKGEGSLETLKDEY